MDPLFSSINSIKTNKNIKKMSSGIRKDLLQVLVYHQIEYNHKIGFLQEIRVYF